MADLEDIIEAVVDIEDLVEEVAEPDELIADFVEDPLVIVFALLAGIAAVVALLMFLLTMVLLVVSIGPLWVVAALTVLSFLTMVLAIGGFLYVRTDVPSDVQRRIDSALDRADGKPRKEGAMTEEEAITELKNEYAKGNIGDHELEQALEDALTSDRPENVVDRYREPATE